MNARQHQMVSQLLQARHWLTAAQLADHLGVTPRSVRTYIAAVNAAAAPQIAIESGPQGYRAHHEVLGEQRDSSTVPPQRSHNLARKLLDSPQGVDLQVVAQDLHISSATVESDLSRIRQRMENTGLTLQRHGSRVILHGTEIAQRHLVSTLAHEELSSSWPTIAELAKSAGLTEFPQARLDEFSAELVDKLDQLGYYVNDLSITDVVLHVAIAASRVNRGRALRQTQFDDDVEHSEITGTIDDLSREVFRTPLGAGDLEHLSSLIITRAVAPSAQRPAPLVDTSVATIVAEALEQVSQNYLVDLQDPAFLQRLSLHVQNLQHRSQEKAWSRNPLTQSLKSSYPMVFQIAVSLTVALKTRLDLEVTEDEIAYIGMHIGGHLEQQGRTNSALTATIVCPGYAQLHTLLRSRINRSLGSSIDVTAVETAINPAWETMTTDLILSTVQPPVPDERIVMIPPLLTEADTARITLAATRRRRSLRLARLRSELQRYIVPEAFISPLAATDENAAIRELGERLVHAGAMSSADIERALAREQMSSTAFTPALAVPHALTMTSGNTAMAIGICGHAMAWGTQRVNVVALVAFSEADREAFQTIFEQLVEVFGEPESVQRILQHSHNVSEFLDELSAVIDD